ENREDSRSSSGPDRSGSLEGRLAAIAINRFIRNAMGHGSARYLSKAAFVASKQPFQSLLVQRNRARIAAASAGWTGSSDRASSRDRSSPESASDSPIIANSSSPFGSQGSARNALATSPRRPPAKCAKAGARRSQTEGAPDGAGSM